MAIHLVVPVFGLHGQACQHVREHLAQGSAPQQQIADALYSPAIDDWGVGVQKQYASLGLASPVSGGDL